MAHEARHPADETLLRAVDGELSPRERAIFARHLAACDACRGRLRQMESAAADASRACIDESGAPPPAADPLRARLSARMAQLSAERDRSWRIRAAERVVRWPVAVPVAAACALLAIAVYLLGSQADPQQPNRFFAAIEPEARPIRALTPGAVAPVTVADLCAGRGPAHERIPTPVRQAILHDYGMDSVPADQYELDYLITPELGGSADRRNLWPERYGSRVWNARVKDDLESLLPQLVCKGKLDLATAQQDIAADWIAAYRKYFRTELPIETRARK
jgi:anti-sigma factor RsiW